MNNKFNTSTYSVLYFEDSATVYTQQRNSFNNGSQNIYKVPLDKGLYKVFRVFSEQGKNAMTESAMDTILTTLIHGESAIKFL